LRYVHTGNGVQNVQVNDVENTDVNRTSSAVLSWSVFNACCKILLNCHGFEVGTVNVLYKLRGVM